MIANMQVNVYVYIHKKQIEYERMKKGWCDRSMVEASV